MLKRVGKKRTWDAALQTRVDAQMIVELSFDNISYT